MADLRIDPQHRSLETDELARPGSSSAPAKGPSFAETLEGALAEVSELQHRSAEEMEKLLAGDVRDVHSAMLALKKADLSFQLMMQVRNKLVQAYREIMRVQG